MSQFYSDPEREAHPWALPDCEVFYVDEGDLLDDEGDPMGAGWYWWGCMPGCLPDSDPYGPFDTEEDAIEDARGTLGE